MHSFFKVMAAGIALLAGFGTGIKRALPPSFTSAPAQDDKQRRAEEKRQRRRAKRITERKNG
jgi:hypothetical protein